MNGCNSVVEIPGEGIGIVCRGNHAPGERHRGGFEGRVTWTDAEAASEIVPIDGARTIVDPLADLRARVDLAAEVRKAFPDGRWAFER